jgi:hypothetical protein
MIFDKWLGTRREKRTAAFYALLFVVLAGLSLAGFEFAFRFLAALIGFLVGDVASRLAAYPFRRRSVDRGHALQPLAAFFIGLVSALALIFIASLAGIAPFSSDEGGASGAFVFGLALGFGFRLRRQLSPTPSEAQGMDMRATSVDALIIGVPLLVILAFLFGAFVLIEYLAAPLIRYFAG